MEEGVKMQRSDWLNDFHSTYMQIVVAQQQNLLNRLNLHRK